MHILYVSPEKLTATRPPALQTLHTVRELCHVHDRVQFVTPWPERVVRKRALELTGHPLPESLQIVSVGPGPDVPCLSRLWPSQVWSGLSKRLLRYVRRAGRREPSSVVYTRHRRTAALLARAEYPPLVFEYHEPESVVVGQRLGAGPLTQRIRKEELMGVQNAAALVTVGEEHARQAAAIYGYDGPVDVIRNGADPIRFGVPAHRRHPQRGSFLYVGSLEPWKGLPLALEAVAMVPRAQLHICGGSPRDPQWKSLVALRQKWNLGDRLLLHGHVPQTNLEPYLATAHAGLLPIDGRHAIAMQYTCPLKLMEYMTAGLPIIASDLPSIKEIVQHGREALLFPTRDAQRMAQCMNALIDDPELTERLSDLARQTAAAYTWRRRAERILVVCQRAVRSRFSTQQGGRAKHAA
jgi:glycosyltransferase involved in cell wall biosynthesis